VLLLVVNLLAGGATRRGGAVRSGKSLQRGDITGRPIQRKLR
jgi:hypothetical protein